MRTQQERDDILAEHKKRHKELLDKERRGKAIILIISFLGSTIGLPLAILLISYAASQ